MKEIERILIKRGVLVSDHGDKDNIYFATKLLDKFRVETDKPAMLNRDIYATVAEFYGERVPESFYANPQDMRYYTSDELAVEQLVSYFRVAVNGVNSADERVFDRVECFKKALPKYAKGGESLLRKYRIMTSDEAKEFARGILCDLCKYTRQWSVEELEEVKYLCSMPTMFSMNTAIECRDNAIDLFLWFKDRKFASIIDKKDVVKLSIRLVGEHSAFSFSHGDKLLLEIATENARDCAMSKKQAKYYNTILKKLGSNAKRESNAKSPYKIAKECLSHNDVVGAAKVLASNGSLLERNLVWLLSRATPSDAIKIVDMIKVKNPIVLVQLLQGIIDDNYGANRVFKFYKNNLIKTHNETEYEHKWRKSVLSIGTKKLLGNVIEQKLADYYRGLESLGNVYIDKEFEKVALPLNTSACGSGLDVLPTGSRLPIKDDYIRAFCYWKDAYDIDTSVIFIKEDGSQHCLYWGNYHAKSFGNSTLCSGDDRGRNGAEYTDFRISEMKAMGYKYAIYTLNGFNSSLNDGEIYCGYQNKSDLDTMAWQPNNIAVKIAVKGDSRAYMGFAIDFDTNEIVILNQMLSSDARVVNPTTYKTIEKYLSKSYLQTYNMAKLLSYRGNIVENKEKADYVFDSKYIGKENQKVIKPCQVETLVSLLK